MDVVALIGNGCSISYNPALAIEPLTKHILSRFAESESTVEEVQRALATLAESSNKADCIVGERCAIPMSIGSVSDRYELERGQKGDLACLIDLGPR